MVERNVRALAGVARVVVSDATEADDALVHLRARLADVEAVRYLGARQMPAGWVAHCNDLQARSDTDYFMWLPHDDEIDADWVTEAEAALDATPRAVLACGPITRVDSAVTTPGRPQIEPYRGFASDDDFTRRADLVSVLTMGDPASLGVLFRGVQRAALAVPLPQVKDEIFADVAWAVRMVNLGPIAVLASPYRKRWYDGSAHSQWPAFTHSEGVRSHWVGWAVDGLNPADAISLITQAWESEHRHRRETEDAWAARLESARLEEERLKDHFESSTSWRVTAPLRAWSRWRGAARPSTPRGDSSESE